MKESHKDKAEIYCNYITHVYSRKTGELLYSLSGTSKLTKKEAINIQIDLSTSEKIFLLEEVLNQQDIVNK